MTARDRRAQLLDVTRAIVGEHGFHGVSIDLVARRAGVSRPIVYEHFGDLNGLLEALVDREGERALTRLADVLPSAADSADRRHVLVRALRGYLEAVQSDPVTWRLVLMPPEGAPELLREQIAIGRSAVVAHLAEVAGPGLGGGGRSPDPELTARMLSAIADDCARLLLTDPDRYTLDRILRHAGWVFDQLQPPDRSSAHRVHPPR